MRCSSGAGASKRISPKTSTRSNPASRSSAVSFSGLIGFVGLIVPHAGRMLVGQDNRYLIPLCVLLGGAFTLGCDIIARVLFAPFELPVGIVMSFLGGPFFIYLLLSRKGRKSLD